MGSNPATPTEEGRFSLAESRPATSSQARSVARRLPQLDPPALGVYDTPEADDLNVGIAYPVGLIEGRKGPVKTFRLAMAQIFAGASQILNGEM